MKIFVPDSGHIGRRQFCMDHEIGNLYSPHRWRTPQNPLYIVENGAYPAFLRGENTLNIDRYFEKIEIVAEYDTPPYFVVVPDIVRGGLKSRDFSVKYLPMIPDGLKRYFVIQKGIEEKDVTPLLGPWTGSLWGAGIPHGRKPRSGDGSNMHTTTGFYSTKGGQARGSTPPHISRGRIQWMDQHL